LKNKEDKMTYKNKKRSIENLLSDIDDIIEVLENQAKRPTGAFEKEKVTDIYNQLLKAYSIKATLITSNDICFCTNY